MKKRALSNDNLSCMDKKMYLLGSIGPVFLLAQSSPEEPKSISPIEQIIIYLGYFIVIIAIALIGYIIYKLKDSLFKYNQTINVEEDEFANKLIQEFHSEETDLRNSVPDENSSHIEDLPSKPITEIQPLHQSITVSPASQPPNRKEHDTNSPETVAQRLKQLKVISTFQGNLDLPIKPNGLIYTMCKGGSCLILPRQESVEMMNYYCRRYTTVFVSCDEGEVVVYGRLQDRLQSLTSNLDSKE